MTRALRFLALAFTIVLVASACGSTDSDDGSATTDDSTGTAAGDADSEADDEAAEADGDGAAAVADLDPAICEALMSEDVKDLVAVAPPGLADSFEALEEVGVAIDGETFTDVFTVLEANPTLGSDLSAFADTAEGCDAEDVGEFRALAGMLTMWEPETDDAYCEALAADDGAGLGDSEPDPTLVIPEHADAFARLEALEENEAPTDEEATQLFADIAGLGLYAEGRCGVVDAFASSLFAAAFMMAAADFDDLEDSDFTFDDLDDEGASNDGDAFGDGTEVDPEVSRVPAAPAVEADLAALLPDDGRITGLEEVTLDLEADDNPGQYLAVVLVPEGWEASTFFGVDYDPPVSSSIGFFTEMSFNAACQGSCEVTDDWAERFSTLIAEGATLTSDESFDEPEGRVVVSADSLTTSVLSGRWSPDVDRMFTCDVDLDEEDADLVPLFSELCRRAQPLWF
ncbi:MAG: hypothetical protein AAF467_07295 [Actinomycetota bacterium]